ncbi:MAG: hypothetical protein ACD_47C00644G0002 [uncultured bacterium]|nr:MAG: hypothetical protein ACD_47C00644G0002 [uncultured bacterium]
MPKSVEERFELMESADDWVSTLVPVTFMTLFGL